MYVFVYMYIDRWNYACRSTIVVLTADNEIAAYSAIHNNNSDPFPYMYYNIQWV